MFRFLKKDTRCCSRTDGECRGNKGNIGDSARAPGCRATRCHDLSGRKERRRGKLTPGVADAGEARATNEGDGAVAVPTVAKKGSAVVLWRSSRSSGVA